MSAGRASAAQLILVRHGATDWNAEGRLQGRRDIPLSRLGRAQAEQAARALSGSGATRVIASPLARAYETGRAIALAAGCPLETDGDLVERSFGPHEGKRRAELGYDGSLREWEGEGIEPYDALTRRALAALTKHACAHPGERIVIVSHGAFLNAFLRAVAPERSYAIGNASLSEVAYDPAATPPWRVLRADEQGHLEA
ncbi:MAG TPA: histidine phosphatase family protein [Limnochordia bacterium]|nr:histidine phosphatase family protein [Limnochordia bacterium]